MAYGPMDECPEHVSAEGLQRTVTRLRSLITAAREVLDASSPVSAIAPATVEEWERYHKAMQKLWIELGRP